MARPFLQLLMEAVQWLAVGSLSFYTGLLLEGIEFMLVAILMRR